MKPHGVQESNTPGRQSPTSLSSAASPTDAPGLCEQHGRLAAGGPGVGGELSVQAALKFSLVMPVNKVNFGEWVKRQKNYRNNTENKTKTKNKKPQTTSHVHSKCPNALVFHLWEQSFQANKTLTEHMALQQHQFIN